VLTGPEVLVDGWRSRDEVAGTEGQRAAQMRKGATGFPAVCNDAESCSSAGAERKPCCRKVRVDVYYYRCL